MNTTNILRNKTTKIVVYSILLLFILLGLARSFRHYYVARLDGDIAESVLPYPPIQKIFDDPVGIKTIMDHEKHQGPNRFFSHYFLHKTFRILPQFLQKFTDPIESVYLTAAISKILMHILILLFFVMIINGKINFFSLSFISTAALLIPFFHTNGKYLAHEIGILDNSASYCFFYALPLIFLLIYYLPIFYELIHHKRIKMNWLLILIWSMFAIMACFSGPLNSPIILITNLLLFLHLFYKNWKANVVTSFHQRIKLCFLKIDKRFYWFLFPITFLAFYSSFLGTYNNVYSDIQLSLTERYSILPKGVFKSFTTVSYIIFLFILISNYLIVSLKYKQDSQTKIIFGLYRFLLVFSLLYIILLPLGGYRPYRPLILRYDTIIPITVLCIITICYTSIFILKKLKIEKWTYFLKSVYPSVFLIILTFFLIRNKTYFHNECEKPSLYIIANAQEDVVVLYNDCRVVGWEPIYYPEESKYYGELLYLWNITDKPKLYYNVVPE